HVELGIALANRLKTIVVGWQENLFHTLVEFYPNWEEAKPRFRPPPPNPSLFAADMPASPLAVKSETSLTNENVTSAQPTVNSSTNEERHRCQRKLNID